MTSAQVQWWRRLHDWADVIHADIQTVISRYLQNISTYLFCTAEKMSRTIIIQNSRLIHARFPIKIDEVWIDRFCVRYDWWRRLQPTSSVSPVWLFMILNAFHEYSLHTEWYGGCAFNPNYGQYYWGYMISNSQMRKTTNNVIRGITDGLGATLHLVNLDLWNTGTSNADHWYFVVINPNKLLSCWTNSQVAVYLRRHDAHLTPL